MSHSTPPQPAPKTSRRGSSFLYEHVRAQEAARRQRFAQLNANSYCTQPTRRNSAYAAATGSCSSISTSALLPPYHDDMVLLVYSSGATDTISNTAIAATGATTSPRTHLANWELEGTGPDFGESDAASVLPSYYDAINHTRLEEEEQDDDDQNNDDGEGREEDQERMAKGSHAPNQVNVGGVAAREEGQGRLDRVSNRPELPVRKEGRRRSVAKFLSAQVFASATGLVAKDRAPAF